MKLVEIKIEELTGESFKPYGEIIGVPHTKPDFSNDELCWLNVKSRRPFVCNNFECHINTSEAMIPVLGQSVVVVALPDNNSVSSNLPDPKSIKAFFIDGSKGFNFKPKVWHCLIYLLSLFCKYKI